MKTQYNSIIEMQQHSTHHRPINQPTNQNRLVNWTQIDVDTYITPEKKT